MLRIINKFPLGFPEIEKLRHDLETVRVGSIPDEPADDWLDEFDPERDSAAVFCEARLCEFRAAMSKNYSELNNLLFTLGEVFESAWCRSDVGELLTSDSDQLRWKSFKSDELSQRLPQDNQETPVAPPEIEEYKGPSQAFLTIEDIERLVPCPKCRDVGELQPATNWHPTMANAIQQARLKAKRNGAVSLEILALRPKSRQELDSVLAIVHPEITSLCQANRDADLEARDAWLYEQCRELVPYSTIIRLLNNQPESWPRLNSVNGVKKAANNHAKRYHRPPIPQRQSGRKPDR